MLALHVQTFKRRCLVASFVGTRGPVGENWVGGISGMAQANLRLLVLKVYLNFRDMKVAGSGCDT